MAATAASDCLEKSVECPVCYDVLREPKQLTCGHSVCKQCSQQLPLTAGHHGSVIQCPVCRFETELKIGENINSLPTNFALANVVEQIEAQKKKQCHKCVGCGEENESKNMFICGTCDGICSCARCMFIKHRDHKSEALDAHINIQYIRMEKWAKETVAPELRIREGPLYEYKTIQTLCDSSNNLLEQIRRLSANAANLILRSMDFRMRKLDRMCDRENKNLSVENGYRFDFAALDQEFNSITNECKMVETGQRDMILELEGIKHRLSTVVIQANRRQRVSKTNIRTKKKCTV